jgi:Na+/H+ antiporter NhaC
MHPHTKKVIMMTTISMCIIMFAYVIPIFVVPVALGVSGAASCTDYGCANTTFTKCGGFSSEGDSSNFAGMWTRGMEGMLCMIGFDTGASVNAFSGQITLNKV